MNDRHQILNHFLFRRESFLIQNQQFTTMSLSVVLKPLIAKARQT